MPESISDVVVTLRDLAQVLFLDRLSPQRTRASILACDWCRRLRFHSRAKICPLPWPDLFQKLGVPGVDSVSIPGPLTQFGDVAILEFYYAMGALVKALQPGTIFEFGTYLGVGALTMAANTSPDCRIYTMDLPDQAASESVPELNRGDKNHIAKSRFRVGEAFLRSPYSARIVQIRDDSMTYRAEKCVTNVDLAVVDGGHSLPVVTKDTENALRILSASGTIIWDDYSPYYPDVVKYLDEFANRYEVHAIPATNYVIYSRKWAGGPGKK
jgi:hypothetical protein